MTNSSNLIETLEVYDLNNPDEGCDIDFIPKEARNMKIDVSLNNSFGFGGTNSTLIFKSV